jgi:hypothetical protein
MENLGYVYLHCDWKYGSFNYNHFRSPRTQSHLDVASVKRCRVHYKGEGGSFPQVRALVSVVGLSYPWLVLAPKLLQLCTNHFVLVLCRFV